jgi:hypothetical protein
LRATRESITNVNRSTRESLSSCPLKISNLKAKNVITATRAFYEYVCPAIERRRRELGPDPTFSQQASREDIDAWTAANKTLNDADQFTYMYRSIYQLR